MLADMGAEVLRVESLNGRDMVRKCCRHMFEWVVRPAMLTSIATRTPSGSTLKTPEAQAIVRWADR